MRAVGSCCGGKRASVKYEVTFTSGEKQKYDTVGEAQAAIQAADGGTFRAVAA